MTNIYVRDLWKYANRTEIVHKMKDLKFKLFDSDTTVPKKQN